MIVNWICLQSLSASKHEIACMLLLADAFQYLSRLWFQCSCSTAGVFNLFKAKEPLVGREAAGSHFAYCIILCGQTYE